MPTFGAAVRPDLEHRAAHTTGAWLLLATLLLPIARNAWVPTADGAAVLVTGSVAEPGWHWAAGSTVSAALRAAGGPVSLDERTVRDGDRLDVGVGGVILSAGADPVLFGGTIDPNHATAEQLALVPGFDEALANAVVTHRGLHGPFTAVHDLAPVLHGGAFDRAAASLWVAPLPAPSLQTGTARDLERFPGVGPVLAARLVAHRQAHGPFAGEADLRAVSGVGAVLAAELAKALDR